MILPLFFVALSICLASDVTAVEAPLASLPYGTFRGLNTGNLTKFLGVPFANAARFETPKAPRLLHGVQNATDFGSACPQQALSSLPIPFVIATYPSISEECLTLDVFKPIASNSGSKLPVLVWIYGGGFEIGNTRDVDVSPVVNRAIEMNEPFIVVTPNYRLNAFGFLAGKEVDTAGISNLGLRDQIFALEWVKGTSLSSAGILTEWCCQSAGAISTALLLLSNKKNSNALFRGAFMDSGSPTLASTSLADGQSDYDNLAAANNCTGSPDTLDCLRHIPFEAFMSTVNQTPDFLSNRSLALVWHPRVDGDVVVNHPLVSVSHGLHAKIPIMTGDCDDEGTLFTLTLANVTTDAEFLGYLPASSQKDIARIGELYPNDPIQGSPFNTGTANQLTPEYKRLAAFQGDLFFTGPRRFFLEHVSATQDAWSWLIKRGKAKSLGAYHGSDFQIWFPPNETSETAGADALINFINTLDPNRPAKSSIIRPSIFWPKWNTPSSAGSSSLLTFNDPDTINITAEDFRVDGIQFLNDLLWEKLWVTGPIGWPHKY
ncbi:carotenoid ester lipase precursor [Mycena vulgaris]|nr:carotenoid ester lipase precursor [Mycena vulgaris]